jgi:mannose-6-phosphate isomerase-like protein (cupin superfamily)
MNRSRQPVRIVPKGWGREVWIANNDLYCGKILEIQKGKRCSLHYHQIKNETFFLRSGRMLVRVKEQTGGDVVEEFEMVPGECMDVPTGLIHQMVALEDCELFEFSTQHFDSDSHRLVKGD